MTNFLGLLLFAVGGVLFTLALIVFTVVASVVVFGTVALFAIPVMMLLVGAWMLGDI